MDCSHLVYRMATGFLLCSLLWSVMEAADRRDPSEFDARRRVRTAEQLLDAGEHDRAVTALQAVIEQFPESQVRFHAHLLLGKDLLLRQQDSAASIEHFRRAGGIRSLATDDRPLAGDDLDLWLESQHMIGVAYYQAGNYGESFSVLRRITVDYPNSVWANHSYYYIGMAHFMQQNWGRAIRYLEMVGTFVDPSGPEAELIEAGQRIFARVEDADLPIMERLNMQAEVEISTSSGDRVVVPLIALSRSTGTYIASAPTAVGPVIPNDDVLQVLSGDQINIRYVDANTATGEANVVRERTAQVVSTGSVAFTDATWHARSRNAFIGQPVFIVVEDADLSTSDEANEASVVVVSQFREDSDQPVDLLDEDGVPVGPRWRIRDEVRMSLREVRDSEHGGVYRTGRFQGSLHLVEGEENAGTRTVLRTVPGDRLLVTYIDELHAGGAFQRTVEASINVAGRYTGGLQQVGGDLEEVVDGARKSIIESRAYLELARIFTDMGLTDGAKGQVEEGLDRVNSVIRTEALPEDLIQQAFVLRWDKQILIGDMPGAIATCRAFNQRFPESRYADLALLRIGQALIQTGDYAQAREVLNAIVALDDEDALAEAQFLIAQAIEAEAGRLEPAIPTYRAIATNYPQSRFAGDALGRLIQYNIDAGDFITATDMLRTVFEQYPDKDWLDRMLVRWAVMAFRQGDYDLSLRKAQRLLMEYPDSSQAALMRQLITRIAERRDRAARSGAN
ncbi:MAG: hypothetical protein EA401_12610 [Planctomycetota bacterium]|nr:MAG: hypothetical protein EA401_12610 [Planctomycetota bacterium]